VDGSTIMANLRNRRCGECFGYSISVLVFGSGTNIVDSERSRGTVLINGWWKSPMNFLVYLFIGIMVFFRSVFFMKSRMNREVHVRFCERFGGETPPCRPIITVIGALEPIFICLMHLKSIITSLLMNFQKIRSRVTSWVRDI
jgi:hypothetical protein